MIWQLIRLDPAWRSAPLLCAGVCVLFIIQRVFAAGSTMVIPAFAAIGAAVATVNARKDDSAFLSNLPATVRQVMLSRLISMAVLLWGPAVLMEVILPVSRVQRSSPNPLIAWSLVSILLLCSSFTEDRQLTLPRSMKIPGWTWFIASTVFAAVYIPLSELRPINEQTGTIGTLVCYLCGAAVFVRAWQVFPLSFQFAPPIEIGSSPGTESSVASRHRHPWMTLLRMVFPFAGLDFILLLLLVWIYRGGSALSFPLFLPVIYWHSFRKRLSWLSCLPLGSRWLLGLMVAPMLITISVACVFRVHETGLRNIMVTITVNCGVYLLAALATQLCHSHRSQKVRGPVVAAIAVEAVLTMPWIMKSFNPIRWVSGILPASRPQAIAIASLSLAALYWALNAAFRKSEFVEKPQ